MEKTNLKLFHRASLTTTQKTLLGIFLVAFLGIGTHLLMGLVFGDSRLQFTGKNGRERLSNNKAVAQMFIANENNLTEVKYHLGNLHLWPGEHLLFELRDAECQNVITKDTINPILITSPIYTRFDFESIPDSQGNTYCAVISYESPYKRDSDTFPFIHTSEAPGQHYTLLENQKLREDKTLQFKPVYGVGNTRQSIWTLIERMSQYKPGCIKGAPLLVLLLTTLGLSFIFGLILILSKEEDRSE